MLMYKTGHPPFWTQSQASREKLRLSPETSSLIFEYRKPRMPPIHGLVARLVDPTPRQMYSRGGKEREPRCKQEQEVKEWLKAFAFVAADNANITGRHALLIIAKEVVDARALLRMKEIGCK